MVLSHCPSIFMATTTPPLPVPGLRLITTLLVVSDYNQMGHLYDMSDSSSGIVYNDCIKLWCVFRLQTTNRVIALVQCIVICTVYCYLTSLSLYLSDMTIHIGMNVRFESTNTHLSKMIHIASTLYHISIPLDI